jgi:hypothetical protein
VILNYIGISVILNYIEISVILNYIGISVPELNGISVILNYKSGSRRRRQINYGSGSYWDIVVR